MTPEFDGLAVETLEHLADALASGRLSAYDAQRLREYVPAERAEATCQSLSALVALGASPPQIAWTLRLLARERRARRAARDDIELVWTGPEEGGTASRDTRVVVRELFTRAERSLLIASYLTWDWDLMFGELARRMEASAALHVRMIVNIKAPKEGATIDVVSTFARDFRAQWPGARRPEVFYDPRTTALQGKHKVSMHAKCVIADGRRVLVTSANFTEAAQVRNIETGIALDDATMALALTQQFENLVATGALVRLPGV